MLRVRETTVPRDDHERQGIGTHKDIGMDKRKYSGKGGKGKNNRHGSGRGFGNNGGRSRSDRVDDRVSASPTHLAKVKDPIIELLSMLRMNPSTDGIRNIAQYVNDEKADYTNLGKAVRGIMPRPLTDEEEALVKRLGTNTGIC
jgi:hypothetical protein